MRKKRVLAVVLAAVMTFGGVMSVNADEIQDLKNQQAATQDDLTEVNSSINTLQAQQEELLGQIDSVDAQLVITLASIDSLNAQIDEQNVKLAQTESDLAAAQEQKDVEYEAMKKRIQYLYETGGNAGWATILLEEESITELLNQAEYTQKMYDYDRQCLEEYAATVTQVTELQTQQQQEYSELVSMKSEQELQQQELSNILADLQLTSENYDEQLANAQALAAQYTDLINQQNVQIQILEEAQQKAAAEAAAAAAAQAAAEAEAANAAAAQAAQEAAAQAAAAAAAGDAQAAAEAQAAAQAAAAQAAAAAQQQQQQQQQQQNTSNSGNTSSGGGASSSSGSALGQQIADYACQFVGNPYVWGGNSLTNGTDCSGFVHLVYAAFGYSVSRQSGALAGDGYGVSYSEAQPGDIICYSGHVAIYLGNGAIVHASDEISGIKISYNAAYRPIVAVRRIVG